MASNELDPLRQQVIIEVDNAIAQLRAVERHGERTSNAVSKIGRRAKRWIKGVGVAAVTAFAAALAAGARSAIDFQKGMAEVSTLVDTSTVSMTHLRRGLLDLHKATGQALPDLTKGLYQTISAGVPAAQAIQFLGVAAKASIGGVTDVATAVDGMTTAANAWGIEASKASQISDKFFTAVKAGKTTFGELSQSIGTAAPIAASLGVSLEELLAAAAALTKGGIDTGTALTYLRGTLNKLLRPSEAAATVAEGLEIELGAAAVKAKGFTGILEELTEKIGDNQQAQADIFEDTRALTAVMALVGEQSDDYRQILDEMHTSQGAAQIAFDKMNGTVAQQAKIFKANLNVALTNLGATILPTVNRMLQTMNDWFTRMEGPAATFISQMRELGIEIEGMTETALKLTLDDITKKLPETVRVGGLQRKYRTRTGPSLGALTRAAGPGQVPTFEEEYFEAARLVKLSETSSKEIRAQIEKNRVMVEKMGKNIKGYTKDQMDYFNGLKAAVVDYKREMEPIASLLEEYELVQRAIAEGGLTKPTVPTPTTVTGTTETVVDDEELERIEQAKEKLKQLNRELIIRHAKTDEQKAAVIELFAAEDALNAALEAQATLGKDAARFAIEGTTSRKKAAENLVVILEDADEDVQDLIDGMEEFTDAEIEASKIALDVESNMTRVVAAVQSLADTFELFGDFGNTLEGIARGFVKVDRARTMLMSATSVSGTILGAGGVLGGFASIAEGFARRDRELKEEQRRLTEALQDSTRAYREAVRVMFESATIGGGVRGQALRQAESGAARIKALQGRGGLNPQGAQEVADILRGLVDAGILDGSVLDLYDAQIHSRVKGGGPTDIVGGPNLDEWLQTNVYGPLDQFADRFGEAGDSIAGVMRNVGLGVDVFGDSMEQSSERFLSGLLGLDLSEVLRERIEAALGLSGAQRTAAMEALAREITAVLLGPRPGTNPNPFGDNLTVSDLIGDTELTPDDLRTLVRELLGFSDEDGGRYSTSYQIGRSITDIQANELLAWQETQTMWLERIHQALDSHGERDANIINNFYGVETGDIADRVAESIEHRIREHYVS